MEPVVCKNCRYAKRKSTRKKVEGVLNLVESGIRRCECEELFHSAYVNAY
jgi:hypothetical protein